jgi:hypothetical protein
MYLFAAAVFIILLSKTYKSTHDTQKYWGNNNEN